LLDDRLARRDEAVVRAVDRDHVRAGRVDLELLRRLLKAIAKSTSFVLHLDRNRIAREVEARFISRAAPHSYVPEAVDIVASVVERPAETGDALTRCAGHASSHLLVDRPVSDHGLDQLTRRGDRQPDAGVEAQ